MSIFFPRSIKIINLDNIYMHNMYNPSAEVTAIDGPLRFEHVTFLNMSLYVLKINFTSIYLHVLGLTLSQSTLPVNCRGSGC